MSDFCNLGAWVWAWVVFADRPAMLGIALLAYVFGLRHAFDPDHIAAIDNVVRKLMQNGKAPFAVGWFFSLGHSTIVVLASVAIAIAGKAAQNNFAWFNEIGGVIGATVSALFLLLIGIANIFVLKSIWSALMRARRGGDIGTADLDALLAGRGLLARLFRPLFRFVSGSHQMYLIGFLFGLGFDTATEIGLLGIAATQAGQGLPIWAILVFPALFTAGMSLMDTTDSLLMTGAYGWALVNPVRKLWYNLTMRAASVVIAVMIGGLEALEAIGNRLGLAGRFWGFVDDLSSDLGNFGYLIVGIFILTWIMSVLVYRAQSFAGDRRREAAP